MPAQASSHLMEQMKSQEGWEATGTGGSPIQATFKQLLEAAFITKVGTRNNFLYEGACYQGLKRATAVSISSHSHPVERYQARACRSSLGKKTI